MIKFRSLSSGSSGNASIVQVGPHYLLIDAGLSLRQLDKYFQEIDIDPNLLDLILLTHAHSDHSKSLAKFAAKYNKPVHMTRETYHTLAKHGELAELQVNFLQEEIKLTEAIIKIFRLPHVGVHHSGVDDAGGNVGFLFIRKNGGAEKKLAYFTDLGVMPETIYPHIENCDFYFLEANHDVLWQKSSRRPYQVIERNLSSFGHLSNEQAAAVLTRVVHKDPQHRRTKAVMLGHLSKECNSHELAKKTIEDILEKHHLFKLELKIAPEKALSEQIII